MRVRGVPPIKQQAGREGRREREKERKKERELFENKSTANTTCIINVYRKILKNDTKGEKKETGITKQERKEVIKRDRKRREGQRGEEEAETKRRRKCVKHSCLPLVLARLALESVLSAASLPESSLTPQTRTKRSFGPFVIASKSSTAPSDVHTGCDLDLCGDAR